MGTTSTFSAIPILFSHDYTYPLALASCLKVALCVCCFLGRVSSRPHGTTINAQQSLSLMAVHNSEENQACAAMLWKTQNGYIDRPLWRVTLPSLFREMKSVCFSMAPLEVMGLTWVWFSQPRPPHARVSHIKFQIVNFLAINLVPYWNLSH